MSTIDPRFTVALATPINHAQHGRIDALRVLILSGVAGFADGYRFRPLRNAAVATEEDPTPAPDYVETGAELFAASATPSEANAESDLDAFFAAQELPDLPARRSALRDIAKARRSALIAEGFAYGGKVIQTRNNADIGNINSATLAAISNPAFVTDWITADNSDLPLDAAGMIAMQLAMVARGNAIFAAFLAVAAQIEAAADLTALDALAESAATFTA